MMSYDASAHAAKIASRMAVLAMRQPAQLGFRSTPLQSSIFCVFHGQPPPYGWPKAYG
jgi:hypothetical protein